MTEGQFVRAAPLFVVTLSHAVKQFCSRVPALRAALGERRHGGACKKTIMRTRKGQLQVGSRSAPPSLHAHNRDGLHLRTALTEEQRGCENRASTGSSGGMPVRAARTPVGRLREGSQTSYYAVSSKLLQPISIEVGVRVHGVGRAGSCARVSTPRNRICVGYAW